MSKPLRSYQAKWCGNIHQAWNQGARCVVGELSTGGGKTKSLAHIHREHQGPSLVGAHRHELVLQLSMALAEEGLRHNLIASAQARRAIAAEHLAVYGRCFYDPGAQCAVASVDTLVRAELPPGWADRVTLITLDEGHHVVADNKWGSALGRFPQPALRILLPTATPIRADGKGLGLPELGGAGFADAIIHGPPMRWLIDNGWLCDYRVVCPKSDITDFLGEVGASGDWSQAQRSKAAAKSRIVGDVVASYMQWGHGKLGVTFCTDVEIATKTAAAYNEGGVIAAVLTGETDPTVRRDMLRKYARREIMQLVTVDIVSEGFDLPAIEVASMARPTKSLSLWRQQIGRALRTMDGKDKALIIDHVGGWTDPGLGPPDRPVLWSLASRESRSKGKSDAIPTRSCLNPVCLQPYERTHYCCPHCGTVPEPAGRGSPAQVDGDLHELDPAVLAALRGAVDAMDKPDWQYRDELFAQRVPQPGILANLNRHRTNQDAQAQLREAMGRWGAARLREGLDDRRMQRTFFHTYGVDVESAKALKANEAEALRAKIIG